MNALLSNICISIPEFTFLVFITLKLMRRKEMLDLYDIKSNLISVMKVVIPSTFLLDFFNYIIKISPMISKVICYTSIYILLVFILGTKKHSYIEYPKLKQKTFTYLLIGIIICFAIESLTYPIILKLVEKTFNEIKLNMSLVIICSIPSRIINLIILGYLFLKKNNKFQINLGYYIFNNKFFLRLTEGLIVGLVIFELYFIKLLTINNLLNIINSIYEQLFIVISFTFLIPGLIISIVYLCINYCIIIINSDNQNRHK